MPASISPDGPNPTTTPTPQTADRHYGASDLVAAMTAALSAAGLDLDALTVNDLAWFDHFHNGGKAATLELLALAKFPPGGRVLDIGGGYGGPARLVAATIGGQVTVLDATAEFVRAGEWLTGLVKLADRVDFRQGDALAMPFADAAFDGVLLQNVAMHIADKTQLFAEIRRVLKPGGRLAMQDIEFGPTHPVIYPTPWARHAGLSALCSPDQMRAYLRASGLRELHWREVTAMPQVDMATAPKGPQFGHLALGDEYWREASRNLERNQAERRVVTVWAVADRADGP